MSLNYIEAPEYHQLVLNILCVTQLWRHQLMCFKVCFLQN